MIYLFTGNNVHEKLLAYEEFIKSIPKDVEIFKFNRNDFDQNQIGSFYSGSGLFFKKSLVIFSSFLEYDETLNFILYKLP